MYSFPVTILLSPLPQWCGKGPVHAVHQFLSDEGRQLAKSDRAVKGQVLNLLGEELEEVNLGDCPLVHGLDGRFNPWPCQISRQLDDGRCCSDGIVHIVLKLLPLLESFKVVFLSSQPETALSLHDGVVDEFLGHVCDGLCQGVVAFVGLLDVAFLQSFAANMI